MPVRRAGDDNAAAAAAREARRLAEEQTRKQVEKAAARAGEVVVPKSQTLRSLAAQLEVRPEELVRANPQLGSRRQLKAGETLNLPNSSFAQSAGAASSRPAAQVDPRLTQRGDLTIGQRVPGAAGNFDVATVAYQDDDKSGGNHNVYVRVLDASGAEIPGDQLSKWFEVRYVSGDGQPEQRASLKSNDPSGVARNAWTTGENGGGPSASYADVPLWGQDRTRVWVQPKDVPGNPYAGFGSQDVGPLYMPAKHHVNYFVTFRASPGAATVPAAPPSTTQPATPPATQPAASDASARRIAACAQGREIGGPLGAATTVPGVGTVQRYAGGAATEGECAVVDGQAGAHLVKNAFYRTYAQGDTASRLGAPLADEGWEGGVYQQRFEHGRMVWADGKVRLELDASAPAASPAAPAATPAQAPSPSSADGATGSKLAQLLAVSPDLETNQDLINYFYKVGGNTWTGACNAAASYGVDLNELVKDRSAKVAAPAQAAAPAAPAPAARPADLGALVEGVYRDVLGRASDPGGKATWMRASQDLRASGSTDAEIRSALVSKFQQSEEYLAKAKATTPTSGPAPVAGPTAPGPVGAPGSVYAPYEVAGGATVNGRLGFHWRSDVADSDMGRAQQIIDRAKALGAGYCTLLVEPGNPEANAALIAKLQQNGITPVVRMYVGGSPDSWSDGDIAQMGKCAEKLAAMGVKLIQVGNEPNLETGLKDRGGLNQAAWQAYLDRSVDRQAQALLAVKRAVGNSAQVGLPPVGVGCPDKVEWGCISPETYYPALLKAIKRVETQSKMSIVDWIPTHTYGMDQPGTAPRPDTARGHLGYGPKTASWYEDTAASVLGRRMRSLSTEGGAEPNAFRGDPARTEALMQESLAALAGNKNLTDCLWLLYDDAGMEKGEWGKWDKMALWDGERNWGTGLTDLRTAYEKARGGK